MLCRLPYPGRGEVDHRGHALGEDSFGPSYPAIVVRAHLDLLTLAVFVDSRAPIIYRGPVLTVEDMEPFDSTKPELGGWLWPPE
jgi:hypothetical protein